MRKYYHVPRGEQDIRRNICVQDGNFGRVLAIANNSADADLIVESLNSQESDHSYRKFIVEG